MGCGVREEQLTISDCHCGEGSRFRQLDQVQFDLLGRDP